MAGHRKSFWRAARRSLRAWTLPKNKLSGTKRALAHMLPCSLAHLTSTWLPAHSSMPCKQAGTGCLGMLSDKLLPSHLTGSLPDKPALCSQFPTEHPPAATPPTVWTLFAKIMRPPAQLLPPSSLCASPMAGSRGLPPFRITLSIRVGAETGTIVSAPLIRRVASPSCTANECFPFVRMLTRQTCVARFGGMPHILCKAKRVSKATP